MEVSFQKLWRDGGYAKDNKLKDTLIYLRKLTETLSLPITAFDMVITEVFQELDEGKQYPLDGCKCGCEIENSGSAITHEMKDRLIAFSEKIELYAIDAAEQRYNTNIKKYIEKQTPVKTSWYKKKIF